MPFFFSITNLTIRSVASSTVGHLWIPRILEWCPYLEYFKIDSNKCIVVEGPWLQPCGSPRDKPLAECQYRPKHTRLVSFSVINASLSHGDLQDLLEVSPHLKHLRVMISDHIDQGSIFNMDQFLQHARFFSLGRRVALETFIISIKGQPIDGGKIGEKIFGLSPYASDITVQIQDFRPALLNMLRDRPNVITSLEIVNGN
ncbi:hypothetical protein EC991_009226 [Linnemannia zychae]|nr:hypothetical protein EC991_009226 [Linnemannia zychae]